MNRSPEAIAALLDRELRPLIKGQLRLSRHERMLYATDASIYQIEPVGVIHPSDMTEVPRILAYCNHRGIVVLPRGGGTSLPGQCVNKALVLDYSPVARQIIEVDPNLQWCRVQPGIVVDELNRQLAPRGVFFAPDPATSAQCTIGGCIGNNAAGARSIRYGRTSENVLGLTVSLADGTIARLGRGAGHHDAVAMQLAHGVSGVVRGVENEIRQHYPKTIRRNAGYALDCILAQLDANVSYEDLDLTPLLCGSEGTLAVTLEAKLKLHPLPKAKGLAIISFTSAEDALAAVEACLGTQCTAVELIDDVVLEAARGNTECRRYMDLLPEVDDAPPAAVLYVEYQQHSQDAVQARFDMLERALHKPAMARHADDSALLRAWALRRASEPLLHALGGRRKPITCVEDNAVPVENLQKFVEGFKEIVERHGTRAAYWAHASVGVLHVRPMLNLHDPADREHFVGIAQEVAAWARECGGVMSGEHGDGRLRGPLLREFYGDRLIDAFRDVKHVFDPVGVLNRGIITDPAPLVSMTQHLRILPDDRDLQFPNVRTHFEYREGFQEAVERCNGAGVCRKIAGGTMCPSYRATLDERHCTRGRANALRLAITGQFGRKGKPDWNDRETLETLSLCLSCKACKSECPSSVDVAQLKAEYLARSYRAAHWTPLWARAFGHIRTISRIASHIPNLTNALLKGNLTKLLLARLLHIDPRRAMPRFEVSLHRKLPRAAEKGTRRVVLFPDCFITYSEPRIGLIAVDVLRKLGYEVIVPRTACCGRSFISTGLLKQATRSADKVLRRLKQYIDDPGVEAIVVAEPSCLSAFKDDYLSLKLKSPRALREGLAAKAMLIEEFVEARWENHPRRPAIREDSSVPMVLLHAHCHQKALWTAETSARLLRRLCGSKLSVLDAGCCGMAGSFGFTKERYDLSLKIGEISLLPVVRSAPPDALIVAPGTSCRHQIKDGAQREAIHPIELVARFML